MRSNDSGGTVDPVVAEMANDGLGRDPHTVRTTTPTGHTYTGRAGPAP